MIKYLVYLLTILVVGSAVAQNPTILQGNYITNVFGNANFVKNPNALVVGSSTTTNPFVTTNAATITRVTTTPLIATSKFTMTTSTNAGYADWEFRAFDAGMKYQICELRFMYKGFSVGTTTAQVISGASTVIASQVLNPATDPQTVSIVFNCGDLSQTTKFRLQQSGSILTGTNEIGAIYAGLATNMSTVAQAQAIFRAQDTNGATTTSGVIASVIFPSTVFDSDGGYNNATGIYTIRRAGRYLVHARVAFALGNPFPAGIDNYLYLNKNGTSFATAFWSTTSFAQYPNPQITSIVDLNVGDQIAVAVLQNTTSSRSLLGSNSLWSDFQLTRFPTASEQVLTPNITSTWGAIRFLTSSTIFQSINTATYTSGNSTLFGDAATTLYGKATVTGANTSQITIPNMPVGSYRVKYSGTLFANSGGSATNAQCNARIIETTTSNIVSQITWQGQPSQNVDNNTNGLEGIFSNTSVGTRTFRIDIGMVFPTTGIASQRCGFLIQANDTGSTASTVGQPFMIVHPLDYQTPLPTFIDQTPYTVTATSLTAPVAPYGRFEASGSGTTITLFGCTATTKGYNVEVKRVDASNNITVSRSGTDTIDGATTDVLAVNYQATQYVCNGSGGWRRF